MKKLLISAGAVALAVPSGANAGITVLEGSDATGFHHDAGYTSQLFGYLSEGSALPVLVFGSAALSGAPVGTTYTTDLSGLSASSYSALYIQSPGGCCDQNRTGSLAYETEIASFIAAGGNLAIQDYQGGDWGSILDFNAPSSVIGGYGGGAGGATCFDSEVFNADALAKGFTQPGALGCWGHQSYDMNYFAPLGFISLVESNNGLGTGWSSFLARGGTIGTPTGGVPEPSTWAMMLVGFFGLGAVLRTRRRKPTTVSVSYA